MGIFSAVARFLSPPRPVESPPRPVEGLVTAADTGQPLPGILVDVTAMKRHHGWPIYTHTDAAGHFRVNVAVGEDYFITVYPPPDSGYLGECAHFDRWPEGAKSLVQDFRLPRGVLVHGRVLDGADGGPVAGASVEYNAMPDNSAQNTGGSNLGYKFRSPVLADADGRFTLTALSGAGYLSVETPERIYIRRPLVAGPYARVVSMPMGYTPIELSPSQTSSEEVIVRLQRGRTVTLQAVGPSGEHLPEVRAGWLGCDAVHNEIWNNGEDFADGNIVVEGVDPGCTTRVFLLDPERRLGAVYDMTANTPAGPIEVRMQPNGTIKGQAISAGGKGVDAQVYLKMSYDPRDEQLSIQQADIFRYEFYDNFAQPRRRVDWFARGRFRIENVLPGIPLALIAAGKDDAWCAVPFELRPGEHRDVGKLAMQPWRQGSGS